MQSFVANIRSLALLPGGAILPRSNRRARIVAFAALALGFVLLLRPDLLPVVLTSLSEAYLQVWEKRHATAAALIAAGGDAAVPME